MRAVVRANFGAMGRPVSFFASVLLHVAAVVWIVFGPPPDPQPRQRIYDMLIRPQEKHIVWYRVRDRLPDVRPSQAAARPDRRPLRAAKKFEQRMVAGPQDDPRAPRLVWAPRSEEHTSELQSRGHLV